MTLLGIRALIYVLGLLTSVILARILGPHERGVWAVALLVSGLVALVSELGLSAAVFSLSRQHRDRRRAVLTVASLMALSSALLAMAAALVGVSRGSFPLVGGMPRDVLAFALAGVVLTNLMGIGRQALLEDGDLLGGAGSQLVQAGTLFVLLAILPILGVSTRRAIVVFIVSLAVAITFVLARLAGRELLSPCWDRGFLVPLLRTGSMAHVATLALFLMFRFDLLLVNHLLGPSAAGLYSVSLSLSEILRGLAEIGQMIVLARSSSADLMTVVRETTRLTVLGTVVGGVAAPLLGYWMIPLVFGRDFSGTVAPFVALVPGAVGLAISYCIAPVLILRGRTRVSAGAAAAGFLTMVVLDVLLIPRWGLVGAALVSSLSYWLAAILQLRAIAAPQALKLAELVPDRTDLMKLVDLVRHPPWRVRW